MITMLRGRFSLLFWLLAVAGGSAVFAGCGGSKSYVLTRKVPEDFILRLSRQACPPRNCPEYTWQVGHTGRVSYEGLNYIDPKGQLEKQLTESELAHVIELMKRSVFHEFDNFYEAPAKTDRQPLMITYQVNGERKTVIDNGSAPERFYKLVEELEAVVTLYNLEPPRKPEPPRVEPASAIRHEQPAR
jgi:hypothetical protein